MFVENDANASLWAESRFGAARGYRDVFLIAVGTGIGASIMINGDLYRGRSASLASRGTPGRARRAALRLRQPRLLGAVRERERAGGGGPRVRRHSPEAAIRLLQLGGGTPEGISGPQVTRAAREGDPAALRCFQIVGSWLGQGMADLAAVHRPRLFRDRRRRIGSRQPARRPGALGLRARPARPRLPRFRRRQGSLSSARTRHRRRRGPGPGRQRGPGAGGHTAGDAPGQVPSATAPAAAGPQRLDDRAVSPAPAVPRAGRPCAVPGSRTRPRTPRPRRTPPVPAPSSPPRSRPPGSPAPEQGGPGTLGYRVQLGQRRGGGGNSARRRSAPGRDRSRHLDHLGIVHPARPRLPVPPGLRVTLRPAVPGLSGAFPVPLVRAAVTVPLVRAAVTVPLVRAAVTVPLVRAAAAVPFVRAAAAVQPVRAAVTARGVAARLTVAGVTSALAAGPC